MHIIYAARVIGTPDHDRCNALSSLGHNVTVLLFSKAIEYVWDLPTPPLYHLIKISPGAKWSVRLSGVMRLVRSALSLEAGILLVYGYQEIALGILAIIWRILGRTTISINDSKFDDYDRRLLLDIMKVILLLPYQGVLAASERAAAYARYLGKQTELYYCAIDVDRVGEYSKQSYDSCSFEDRSFVMVARFVKKKNHIFLLEAYERYLNAANNPRNLVLVGYGELELEIAAKINASDNLRQRVKILGYKKSAEIPSILGRSLALLLPSTEEQFGIVVTEALASRIPVILSPACGANDLVVEHLNGFSVSVSDPLSWANYMLQIAGDSGSWQKMSIAAAESARKANTSTFCDAIANLLPDRDRQSFEANVRA